VGSREVANAMGEDVRALWRETSEVGRGGAMKGQQE